MAMTLNVTSAEQLDLIDYVDYCNTTVDIDDVDSVLESAGALRALANNRSMIVRALNDYLSRPRYFERTNTYSSQSLLLAEEKTFTLRANMWIKPHAYAPGVEWDEQVYAYGFAHNHNFQFLTVGAFGPGYVTDIYEFDPTNACLRDGESVSLKFLERTTLPFGKVMFYRRAIDVHIQHPPESFSMSLNFMPNNKEIYTTEQIEFDVTRSAIKSTIASHVIQQVDLLKMASLIGDESTGAMALRVATVAPSTKARLAAFECAAALLPGEERRIWQAALADVSDEVTSVARNCLEHC